MKSFKLLTLLLCMLALTSANRPDHGHRGPHDGPADHRPGLDCHRKIGQCKVIEGMMQKYYRYNINDTVIAVHDAGFTSICQDISNGISCVKQSLLDPDCENLPPQIRSIVQESIALAEYVCEDRGEDVSRYWDCLLNPEFITKAIACPKKFQPKHGCDTLVFEDIAECVGIGARYSRGSCDPDSDVGALAQDIMMKVIYLGKKC